MCELPGSPSPADPGPPGLSMAAGAPATSADARLHDYLDHVCAPLVGIVPYDRRHELRAELRDHLEGLVASHEERGIDREVAVANALRQFGDPRRLARQCAREWSAPKVPVHLQPAWKALPTALCSFAFATSIALVLNLTKQQGFAPGVAGATWGALTPGIKFLIWLSVLYLLPLIAGLGTGLLAPARHALGVFFALSAIIPCLVLVFLMDTSPSGLAPQVEACLELAWLQVSLWVPLGCGSAALGGSLRRWLVPRSPRRALD